MRRRKVTYPVARTSRRPGAPGNPFSPPEAISIDLDARSGKGGLTVGSRVRIGNSGLYSGEIAVVESLPSGVIPSAIVRTERGRTRRVRAIDLEIIKEDH